MVMSSHKNIRSVKDIRTHSGSVKQTSTPYKAYLQISCLEMEKSRRLRERDAAMDRINAIDVRIMEIEVEKEGLLGVIDRAPGASRNNPEKISGGFKIRY